jgi:hypothetical protein
MQYLPNNFSYFKNHNYKWQEGKIEEVFVGGPIIGPYHDPSVLVEMFDQPIENIQCCSMFHIVFKSLDHCAWLIRIGNIQ